MSILNSEDVTETFIYCRDPENGTVEAEGIGLTVKFDASRLAEKKELIRQMLLELPDQFMKSKGGGWSFLNACDDKHGNQWTDYHAVMAQLFYLGAGIDMVEILLPRELWEVAPGGMPYYAVVDN